MLRSSVRLSVCLSHYLMVMGQTAPSSKRAMITGYYK